MLELRPTTEDLIAALSAEEQVAIDLLLDRSLSDRDLRAAVGDPAVADLDEADQEVLQRLVPDRARRGAIVSLARQLRQVGVTIRPRRMP
jgi:hypothetical protein